MKPATYNYEKNVRGDTIGSRTVTVVIDSNPASISSARMQIRTDSGDLIHDASVSIAANVVTINSIDGATTATFPVDNLKYDLELTLSGGIIRTYLQGDVPIIQDRPGKAKATFLDRKWNLK